MWVNNRIVSYLLLAVLLLGFPLDSMDVLITKTE